MAEYLLSTFRAISFGNHFFELRRQYRASAGDPERELKLLDEMDRIVRDDLANARGGLLTTRRDPRLDLSVRLDPGYQSLARMIEAKIRFAERVLNGQIAGERAQLHE